MNGSRPRRTRARPAPTATCRRSGTGQNPSTSKSSPTSGTSSRPTIPHYGPADARDADLPLRRAGLDPLPVDHRRRTRRSRCPSSPGSGRSSRQDRLFVVVQDLFLTETAQLADVVLPAATWGEKTGTFTNADRTVHLSEQGGRAARRGASGPRHLPRLRAADGLPRQGRRPLIKWYDAGGGVRGLEGVLARAAVRLQRAHLRAAAGQAAESSGRAPRKPRTGRSGSTPTALQHRPDDCETYGHDLETGRRERGDRVPRAQPPGPRDPQAAPTTEPPPRSPSDEYPLCSPTGRTVYHFHTRTKTGRAPRAAGRRARRLGRALRRTPTRSASPRATWSTSPPRGAVRAARVTGPARAWSSCRSTTATGTPQRPRARERADDHRVGPGVEAADVQGRRLPR